METIPFQAQYVVDAAGKRTHVIVPTEFFEKQLSKESVFVDVEEAAQWLKEELAEDVNFRIPFLKSNRTKPMLRRIYPSDWMTTSMGKANKTLMNQRAFIDAQGWVALKYQSSF
jgi:Asp-tRNA(Asn)/Glu-tRNA(Gln) amidotransferase A subunit family amidase